jgi:hypothetical protein
MLDGDGLVRQAAPVGAPAQGQELARADQLCFLAAHPASKKRELRPTAR